MRSYPNIDKAPHRGSRQYTGYCKGRIFHIRPGFDNGWKAIEQNGNGCTLHSKTLDGISRLLTQLEG